MTSPRLSLAAALVAAAALLLALQPGCAKTPPTDTGPAGDGPKVEVPALEKADLNAHGSTFVEPIMKLWTEEFLGKTGDKVRINYQGGGSGAGVTNMTNKLSAFGCSDLPMNKKQSDAAEAAGGPVAHVPLVIGAVVPMYKLDGVDKPLVFSGPLLADIFTGKVTRWNDPKLAALNPGVALPDLDIQPVFRSDPSGTAAIFSDYLCKVDDGFRAAVGTSTTPVWPKGLGTAQNKTDGVAGYIDRSPGSIGFVELTFALDKKAKFGAVVNAAGKPVLADAASITAAAAASLGQKQTAEPYSLHELTYNLTNAAGDGSYPISGMSFAVLYQKQAGAKGRAVVEFLKWATSAEGQKMSAARNYAPLPDDLQKLVKARLDGVELTP